LAIVPRQPTIKVGEANVINYTDSHNGQNFIQYVEHKQAYCKKSEEIDRLKIRNISESFLGGFTNRFVKTISLQMKKLVGSSENLSPMKELPMRIAKGKKDF
jgi:hypothetical protein